MESGGNDLLSELLRPLRLTGVFDSLWRLRAPWAIEGDSEQSCAILHYMVEGDCWISAGDCPPIQLHQGDLAVFPTGTAHRLSDLPGRQGVPLKAVLPQREPGTSGVLVVEGTGDLSRIMCAGLHYDATAATSLYRALPWSLVLDRTQVDQEPLLRDTLASLAAPERRGEPGSQLVTLRAFEMAFVLALRPLLRELSDNPAVLPALRHPGISKALIIVSTRFSEPWTIEALAREVGMSRSAFTATFRELVGEAPARHLTGRRMQEAARLLTETAVPQTAVPPRVGYQSAVGFHLAFRKWFGTTPGEYRGNWPVHKRDRQDVH
ncbi:AraC family transcriptional regulator [Streptomyces sp. H10-C2]|uniref:AraC family transcriptional regulator n=1 Tax=unclassified Streptomyces TaxID=2593676 RepID=UPI0024B8B13B|nr:MULTISPECIES: AraC family transcriptional regulator [unclassified Streptomyces]MDJ0341456.1 AraC family transcriptional regulator [Streptomyces sp. PH10-H1]MDJ0369113.1 AraC family transcriptional regulator [Streptomyces sp. H10-C2]